MKAPKEILVELSINGEMLKTFSRLQIKQAFNAHHTFELVIDHDAMEVTGAHTLQSSQDLVGKFITVCFGQKSAGDNIFKGIITQVGLAQSQGLWGSLVLKGYSPTYLMESGRHFNSFYKRKLSDMLKEASSSLAANDMEIENKPAFQSEIAYMAQYNESNFAFINRLAGEYGEWFYYDGQCLYFGKPSSQEKVDVVYGEHIEKMHFSMQLAPSNVSHFSYNSKDDQLVTSSLPDSVDGADNYTEKVLKVSKELYWNPVLQPVPIRTSSKEELDSYAKSHKARLASGITLLQGEGDEAKLKLGIIINLKVSQKGFGIGSNEHGEYLIIQVNHNIEGTGNYTNSFEAIPASIMVPPYEAQKPLAETQIATVKDNSDPEGKGRVRVQMLWQQQKGQLTDWIRVMAPDAGSSDKVSANRGFVFIPEVGDQVVVGFRYGDANRPFVLGSLFHGKNGGGGSKDNHSKSLTTRTGSTIMLDDAAHTVTMQTSNGNTLKIDEKSGAISITSASSVSISSPVINIRGGESVSIVAPSITIGTLSGEKPTDTVTMEGKTITVHGEDMTNVTSKVLTLDGSEEHTVNGGKYAANVSEMNINGGSKILINSSDTDIS